MIRGRNDRRCWSGRRFRGKVTLMMMRGLLLLMMRRMMVRVLLLLRLLLLVLVIGHCSRKFGWIVSGGARIYWGIITFIIHLDAKALKFLSGKSLHCVGLLKARQGCRTKGIGLDVLGERWRWWWWLRWLLMVYTLVRLSRLIDRRYALRISELQLWKGIELLGQASGIRRVCVRTTQQFHETATSEGALCLQKKHA